LHAVRDQLSQPTGRHVLSKLLAFQARGLNFQSASEASLRLARQAVELGHASGGVEGEAMGLLAWGRALADKGQLLEARPLFERVLQLVRSAAESRIDQELFSDIEWRAEHGLGLVALMFDDYAEARGRFTHALQLCQARASLVGEINCLHRLAAIAINVGDYARARSDSEQTLRLARALSYPWGEGVARLRLGQALHVFGEYTRTAELIAGALAIFREIGDRAYEASTLAHLGHRADSLGDYARARDRLEHALQRAEQRLRECAEQITDDALRRSFLENGAAHRAILTLAHTTAPLV
jgi:tetratricopeptide (TPR) repeat protein